jgi:hypothetical protein
VGLDLQPNNIARDGLVVSGKFDGIVTTAPFLFKVEIHIVMQRHLKLRLIILDLCKTPKQIGLIKFVDIMLHSSYKII